MEQKIQGQYHSKLEESYYKSFTLKELQDFLKTNHRISLYLSGYAINNDENYVPANMLTLLPDSNPPFVKGGKLVIPTEFRRGKLGRMFLGGEIDDLIPVNCLVDLQDENLSVTVVKVI